MIPVPATLGSWRFRRLFLFASAAFCMATVGYCLWADKNTQVAEAAVTMSFVYLMTITGSYVFGASWEDTQTRRLMAKLESSHPKKEEENVG